jgi:hypothetical protein
MLGHVRRNAVGYLALFVALGGTSYAVSSLAPNSVGTPQLKNGAVTGAKVKDHALTAVDFQSNSLPRGPRGATGPAGLSASVVADDLPAATPPGPLSSAVAIKHVTINLPRAGKLVVLDPKVESVNFNNTTNSTVVYTAVGLFLDGVPVSNSGVQCSGCSIPPQTTSLAGPIELPDLSISGVTAGSHTLTLALIGNATNYVTASATRLVVLASG